MSPIDVIDCSDRASILRPPVSPVQNINVFDGIVVMFPNPIVSKLSDEHPANVSLPSVDKLYRKHDDSCEHALNTLSPNIVTFDERKLCKDKQPWNTLEPTDVIVFGNSCEVPILMVVNPVFINVLSGIDVILPSDA